MPRGRFALGFLVDFVVSSSFGDARNVLLADWTGARAGRCSLVRLRISVNENGVNEVASIASSAHAVEVVVSAVAEATGVVRTRHGTLGGQDKLAWDELYRTATVRTHHFEHISRGKTRVKNGFFILPSVVDVDFLLLHNVTVENRMDEFARVAHGARCLGVLGAEVSAENEARDVQIGRWDVHDAIQRNREE
jgi:SpoU rRNA methylase family enzyme